MASTLALRPDDEVRAAMAVLGDTYGNTSETLKTAILRLAAEKRAAALREESTALANDPDDRAEAHQVLSEMENLRAR